MADRALDIAQAHAALAVQKAPELRVLTDVHTGLIDLSDHGPATRRSADDDERAAG